MSLFTETQVTTYLEAWTRENLGRHDSSGYRAYILRFQENLETKRDEQQVAHSNGGLFGMSRAGGCLRSAAFSRAGVEGEMPSGSTRSTWEIGHLCEIMALSMLEAAGFELQGKQREARLEPAFCSAVDAVLVDGPLDLPYPLILSIKSASYKSSTPPRRGQPAKRYGFAQLPLDGIEKAQPGWYLQSQLEMAALKIPRSLVLVVAKDMIAAFQEDSIFQRSGSLTFYAEVLDHEPTVAEALRRPYMAALASVPEHVPPLVAGVALLPVPGDTESGWKGPNQAATGTFNYCYQCGYAPRCKEIRP